MTTTTRALTVQQPWAFAIAEGLKDVENRTWNTHYRGALAIHTAQTVDHGVGLARHDRQAAVRFDEVGARNNLWDARHHLPSRINKPPHPTLALSAIIATVTLTGAHRYEPGCCDSPWAEQTTGVWHWALAGAQILPQPIACRGRLGLWVPADDIQHRIALSTGDQPANAGESPADQARNLT